MPNVTSEAPSSQSIEVDSQTGQVIVEEVTYGPLLAFQFSRCVHFILALYPSCSAYRHIPRDKVHSLSAVLETYMGLCQLPIMMMRAEGVSR